MAQARLSIMRLVLIAFIADKQSAWIDHRDGAVNGLDYAVLIRAVSASRTTSGSLISYTRAMPDICRTL